MIGLTNQTLLGLRDIQTLNFSNSINEKYDLIYKDWKRIYNAKKKYERHRRAILKCVAYSDDGVVEAVEDASKKFYMAVQFHTESLYRTDENMNNIFKSFINICKE